MTEIWKCIDGYEGYKVSSLGRVIGKTGKVLKQQLNSKTGYFHVNIRKSNKQRTTTVHRLVAEAFIPKVEGKNQVNHKNGDKTLNIPQNLEWVTASENRKHAYSIGLFDKDKIIERGMKGGKSARERLGKSIVLKNNKGDAFAFSSVREACESLNLDRRTLQRVLGKEKHFKTIKGFTADYL